MDDWKKEFSREELESMGEAPIEEQKEEEKAPESQASEEKPSEEAKPAEEAKAEQTPELEQKAEESTGEEAKAEEAESEPEEGKPVPYDRFKKVYGQAKQTEREKTELKEKLDFFKRDPDGYYERYSDERPADWKPKAERQEPAATPKATRIIPMREMLNAVVNDPQNKDFHGRSLRDLLAENTPESIAAASDYYQTYVESVREEVRKSQDTEASYKKAIEVEVNSFTDERAKEMFGKPADNLDPESRQKVDAVIHSVIDWIKKTNKLNYSLQDAWFLMRKDDLIKDAVAKGASAIVDNAKRGVTKSVGATTQSTPSDPYGKYLAMSERDLEKMVMEMADTAYTDFLSKATPAFRKKFPQLPYVN